MGSADAHHLNAAARAVEATRDEQVRLVACPTCNATPNRHCTGQAHTSHTSRYTLAAAAGHVPPLPGTIHKGAAHGTT